MNGCETLSGYLDVKISSRSRRGLTPWKAWQKQWCEIKKIDHIENGLEVRFMSAIDGAELNCILLPRSSTICRTESRTKQYAFGLFSTRRNHKPLLFLSGCSESDSQMWMSAMRKMLCVASYLPVGETNFHVSLVDNGHSRAAGLMGLHGVLGTNSQEIVISDPCTGEQKMSWKWYQFHQFHLQATSHPSDDKVVCVMHTSGEFPAGPGQLYLFCNQAARLLNFLVARGKRIRPYAGLVNSRRLSRSEGDLCDIQSKNQITAPDTPICIRSNDGSEDSGVRVSLNSDDFVLKSKVASSLISIGMALLTKTPGGSENGDSLLDLSINDTEFLTAPRRESGISAASGIYEEIPDDIPNLENTETINHVYENPIDIILNSSAKHFVPPPLPPRSNEIANHETYTTMSTPYKQRCNTMPTKDLHRISQIFTADSEYMVMSPSSKKQTSVNTTDGKVQESTYVPMSPVTHKLPHVIHIEACYMAMNNPTTGN